MPIRRPLLALLAFVCAAAAACRSSTPNETAAARFRLGAPEAVDHPPRALAIDVEHYALDIELDPQARSLMATCRVRFWPATESLSFVELDLEGLDVLAVSDERGRALTFDHTSGVLRIELAERLAVRDFAELSIRYAGRPKKGLWFVAPRDGVATQVFTQGECEDARWWFPCADSPADRATSEVRVTMPSHWIAVAAGERVERNEIGGKSIERWRMTAPHAPYLMTLVAGELTVRESAWEGVPLLFLSSPEHADRLEPNLEKTGDVLQFFSELTGTRYPYAKYSQACVANFPFGGMENISATTLTDTTLRDERGRRDTPSTGLVAHEAAHQWFGDLLTCADWSQIWLNEGFATYLDALYTEQRRGVDEFRIRMRDVQDSYTRRDIGPDRRPVVHDVYRDPMDLFFSGHAYEGAAARLHLLRHVLGDKVFFTGLRRYVSENANRAVTTDDLRKSMEASSRVDLAWFFDTWYLKPGFPEFQVAWRYDERRKLVVLTVHQVQDPSDGTPAVFRTPVDVEIKDARGTKVHRVTVDSRRHLFTLECESHPTWVRFDAHGFIPKVVDDKKTTPEWLAIAASSDDVNGRRDAVRVLGRIIDQGSSSEERESARDVLLDRLATDTNGAVRAAAALALGGRARPECRVALETSASSDVEARVRVAALATLGAFAPDAPLAEFALAQYRAGFSWETMGAAAALACGADPARAFEFLNAELGTPSPHGILKGRLIAELTRLNDARVVPLLVTVATDANENDAPRVAAVAGLGRLGRGDPVVRRELLSLLGAESWRVRRETISALGALRDPAVYAPLAEYYRASVQSIERRAIEAVFASAATQG